MPKHEIRLLSRDVNALIEENDMIKNLSGLPEAFQEIGRQLPTVQSTLQRAKTLAEDIPDVQETPQSTNNQAGDIQSQDKAEAPEILLANCKEKVKKLSEIFEKIAGESGKKNEFAFTIYQEYVTKHGKEHQVEILMGGVLKDLIDTIAHRVFQGKMKDEVDQLEKAREDLAKVPPSLPSSTLDKKPGAASQYGDNNRQYNHFGKGDMKNIQGHSFQSNGAMNFGRGVPL